MVKKVKKCTHTGSTKNKASFEKGEFGTMSPFLINFNQGALMTVRKIYSDTNNISFKPSTQLSAEKTARKSLRLGVFKFDAYTLALKCKENTNRVVAYMKHHQRSVPIKFADPFKGQFTREQLKALFKTSPDFKINVEKSGRSYSVSMVHCHRLKGGGPRFSKNAGIHTDDEKHAVPHSRKRSLSKTVLKHNFSLDELKNLRQVAVGLSLTPKHNEDFGEYERFSYSGLNEYADIDVKTPDNHQEITGLALSKHAKIIEKTLELLLEQLDKQVLLDGDVIEAIHDVLHHADPKHINVDHLVATLKIISRKCKDLHKQKKTVPELHKLLKVLAKTLDKMADCKVEKLLFLEAYKPLKEELEKLEKHEEWSISSQAAYAHQSLLRITSDLSETDKALIKVRHFFKGLDCVISAVKEDKLSPLLEAIGEFKEALKKETEKKRWYDKARLLCILLEAKDWTRFKLQLTENIDELSEKEKPYLQSFLIDHLLQIATEHSEDSTRVIAINLIQDFLNEEPIWGVNSLKELKKKAKEKISNVKFALMVELHELAKLHNVLVNSAAEGALLKIGIIAQKKAREGDKENQGLLIRAGIFHEKDGVLDPTLKITKNDFPDEKVPDAPTTIFNKVKAQELNLDAFIKNMAKKSTDLKRKENEDLKYLLETYVPPHCTADGKEGLEFEKRISSFLNGEIKDADGETKQVLLLKANAGGGKTTSARHLEYQLWKAHEKNSKAPIPVVISAAKLHDKTNTAVEEALLEKGFSKAHIKKIIADGTHLVIIFDGYEEMSTRKKVNLHQKNQVWKFNAKTIITCRSQHLSTWDSYASTFSPIVDHKLKTSLLDEVSIREFKREDIDVYFKQFVKSSRAPCKEKEYAEWNNAEIYLKYIKEIPGLSDMLSNPYLLFITATVLPKIVKENPNITSGLMIRNSILKEYLNQWFLREEVRLLEIGVQVGEIGIVKTCYNYLKNFVAKWHNKDNEKDDGLPIVEFDPEEFDSEWAEEFDEKNKPWRTACPFERVGTYGWSMNPILKEYVVFRQMCDVLTDTKKKKGFGDDNFTKLELTNESIIQFFVDELRINSALEAKLKKFVSESADSVAGKNSDKILKAFEKASKDEIKVARPTSPA